jgi:hypothetical protein
MFAAPSPKGTNHQGLYLNSAGELLDRSGRRWGQSQIMALDAVLATPESGEARTKRSTAEWAQSHARAALHEALEEACREHELTDDQHKELAELVDQHLRGEAQADRGKGAIDRDRGKGAVDDDDEDDDDSDFASRVRSYLSSKGLDPKSIEDAIEIAVRNRNAGVDERPSNRFGGGPPIKQRLEAKDLESEYPGISDYPDTMNLGQLDPNRNAPGYRSEVRARSEAAMKRVPGAGTAIRLKTPAHTPTGDAALEDIERELVADYGSAGPKVGVFG